jgi:hypothetical protein
MTNEMRKLMEASASLFETNEPDTWEDDPEYQDMYKKTDHGGECQGKDMDESWREFSDDDAAMSLRQLKTACDATKELKELIQLGDDLPEWVQSKITKASDYLDMVRDYMLAGDDSDIDFDPDPYADSEWASPQYGTKP